MKSCMHIHTHLFMQGHDVYTKINDTMYGFKQIKTPHDLGIGPLQENWRLSPFSVGSHKVSFTYFYFNKILNRNAENVLSSIEI